MHGQRPLARSDGLTGSFKGLRHGAALTGAASWLAILRIGLGRHRAPRTVPPPRAPFYPGEQQLHSELYACPRGRAPPWRKPSADAGRRRSYRGECRSALAPAPRQQHTVSHNIFSNLTPGNVVQLAVFALCLVPLTTDSPFFDRLLLVVAPSCPLASGVVSLHTYAWRCAR